jgi:hypothetical protein
VVAVLNYLARRAVVSFAYLTGTNFRLAFVAEPGGARIALEYNITVAISTKHTQAGSAVPQRHALEAAGEAARFALANVVILVCGADNLVTA